MIVNTLLGKTTNKLDRKSYKLATVVVTENIFEVVLDWEDFADFVKQVRNSKGLSQNDVAEKSGSDGLSKAYVGHIENRYVLPSDLSIGKLIALANGLDIDHEILVAVANSEDKTTIKQIATKKWLSKFLVFFSGWDDLDEKDQYEMLPTINYIAKDIERRLKQKSLIQKGDNQ